MENIPEEEIIPDTIERKVANPNSISELLSMGDLPTLSDRVYRMVHTQEAIDDINSSGIVRNKQSAGLTKSRWGERVFWSRGGEGKYHPLHKGSYVIEAPLSIAEERVVRKEDITAIYTKDEQEKAVNILEQQRVENEKQRLKEKVEDAEELRRIREQLGI